MNDENTSQTIAEMADQRPGSSGLAVLPNPNRPLDMTPAGVSDMNSIDRVNAERTARWAFDEAQSKLKYAGRRTRPDTISGINSTALDYNNMFNPGAPVRRPVMPGFADGGKPETAEQLLARMKATYGGAPAQPAPQQQPPQQSVATVDQPKAKPAGSLIEHAAGLIGNRRAQLVRTLGYSRGGKIKGPGTPTSDSIQALVQETNQPIRVSTKERIVSADQDAALERIAEMLGFESVDAMFEKLTGKPVGPTIKGGQLAAADGSAPWYSPEYVRAANASDKTGLELELERRKNAPTNDPVKQMVASGTLGDGAPVARPVISKAPTAAGPIPEPAPAPGSAIRAVAGTAPASRRAISSADAPAVDNSASAAIDRQGSTYDPAAQLERMQRLRLTSDATSGQITDPAVRKQAVRGLAIMNASRANADSSAINQENLAQAKAGTELRTKLLDPKTPPEERARLIQAAQAMRGNSRQSNLQAIDVEELIDPKQPLLGSRKVPYVFDPATGRSTPMLAQQSADPAAQARAAIARGADPAAVNARLKAMGLPEVQ